MARAIDQKLAAQLFDLSPFPSVVTRLDDHVVLAINSRTSELFGIPQHEARGRVATDYYVDPSQRLAAVERIRRDGRLDNVRTQIRLPDGTTHWVQSSARLVTYDDTPAILSVFTDITEQVTVEQALKASEERLTAQSQALTTLTARYADLEDPFLDRLRDILVVSACGASMRSVAPFRASACTTGQATITTPARCCGATPLRLTFMRSRASV
jgi:PAS domain S-box-containing protein